MAAPYEYYKAKSAYNRGKFEDAIIWYRECSPRYQKHLRKWKKHFDWDVAIIGY